MYSLVHQTRVSGFGDLPRHYLKACGLLPQSMNQFFTSSISSKKGKIYHTNTYFAGFDHLWFQQEPQIKPELSLSKIMTWKHSPFTEIERHLMKTKSLCKEEEKPMRGSVYSWRILIPYDLPVH